MIMPARTARKESGSGWKPSRCGDWFDVGDGDAEGGAG